MKVTSNSPVGACGVPVIRPLAWNAPWISSPAGRKGARSAVRPGFSRPWRSRVTSRLKSSCEASSRPRQRRFPAGWRPSGRGARPAATTAACGEPTRSRRRSDPGRAARTVGLATPRAPGSAGRLGFRSRGRRVSLSRRASGRPKPRPKAATLRMSAWTGKSSSPAGKRTLPAPRTVAPGTSRVKVSRASRDVVARRRASRRPLGSPASRLKSSTRTRPYPRRVARSVPRPVRSTSAVSRPPTWGGRFSPAAAATNAGAPVRSPRSTCWSLRLAR